LLPGDCGAPSSNKDAKQLFQKWKSCFCLSRTRELVNL
jgi:hypothetical protein